MPFERREQVFVSSTYVDLVEERQEVIQTLLEADCIPAGMEMFPASDDDRWTLIRRVINDCDYYIVVVGGRYGSVDPSGGLSYTEMEFDYAVSVKKPIMGFLHGDPGAIPGDKLDLDNELREKLDSFRSKVSEKVVKYWTSAESLGGQVAKSLIQIRKTHPAEGWIRARHALTPEVETDLAQLRARVAELTAEIERAKATPHASVEDLAQGDDPYGLDFLFWYWSKEQVDAKQTFRHSKLSWNSTVDVTWNEILAALGPLMMDECAESTLDDQMDKMAFDAVAEDPGLRPRGLGRFSEVTAASHVIQDVKVQLFSLGLIEQSQRRRAVSDTNTYWTLTPTGREHLMRLRAIRRPAESPTPAPEPEEQ